MRQHLHARIARTSRRPDHPSPTPRIGFIHLHTPRARLQQTHTAFPDGIVLDIMTFL